MPSANRADDQQRVARVLAAVIRLSIARTRPPARRARRPTAPCTSGTSATSPGDDDPRRETRWPADADARDASGIQAAHAGAEDAAARSPQRPFHLLVPRHLDRLRASARSTSFGSSSKPSSAEHLLAQVGEAHRQRIERRETSRPARCRCLRRRSTSRRHLLALRPSGPTCRAGCRRLPARSSGVHRQLADDVAA